MAPPVLSARPQEDPAFYAPSQYSFCDRIAFENMQHNYDQSEAFLTDRSIKIESCRIQYVLTAIVGVGMHYNASSFQKIETV